MQTFKKTPKQKEAVKLLGSKAKNILLFGGSRSGKTAILVYAILVRAAKAKSRHIILRKAFNHVKISIWNDTLPKIAALAGIPYTSNKSDWYYELPNGSQIWIGGLDDKERTEKILGSEYSTIYFNEASQLTYESINIARTRLAEKTTLTNKVYYDCNPPTKSHWTYKLFIRNIDPITKEKLIDPSDYECMLMNPADNVKNLSEDYIKLLESLPRRQRQRFLDGIFLDDIEGALWTDAIIDNNREYEINGRIVKKVIAIDPAVSYGEESDETGIIIAAMNEYGQYYVLEDLSGRYSPLQWGSIVAKRYKNDFINDVIVETNQGGELVVQNLRNINPAISVKRIHASQGKLTRAEPVAALYEQGLVHHVGTFPELEEQLVCYTGKGMDSPDRMDALVYALTSLSDKEIKSYWA